MIVRHLPDALPNEFAGDDPVTLDFAKCIGGRRHL
jgi:hypothetical protein